MIIYLKCGTEIQIDEIDQHLFIGRTWAYKKSRTTRYVARVATVDGKSKEWKLHRLIMSAKDGEFVDHINGDTRDNRRVNLRIATATQSAQNTAKKSNSKSRFKGVTKTNKSYRVRIRHDGKRLQIGEFKDEVEAAYFYDLASLRLHGDFGKRNFLPLV